MLAGLCERLAARGVPLWRVMLGMHAGRRSHRRGLQLALVARARAPAPAPGAAFGEAFR